MIDFLIVKTRLENHPKMTGKGNVLLYFEVKVNHSKSQPIAFNRSI